MIDSDFDEDDEYQQNELEEIFSNSPHGDEVQDFDPNKEDITSDYDSQEEDRYHHRGINRLEDDDVEDEGNRSLANERKRTRRRKLVFDLNQEITGGLNGIPITQSNKIREALLSNTYLNHKQATRDIANFFKTKTKEEIAHI